MKSILRAATRGESRGATSGADSSNKRPNAEATTPQAVAAASRLAAERPGLRIEAPAVALAAMQAIVNFNKRANAWRPRPPAGIGTPVAQLLTGISGNECQGANMHLLWWALIAAIIAMVAGLMGFGGVAVAASTVARFLFGLFLIVFLLLLLMGLLAVSSVP